MLVHSVSVMADNKRFCDGNSHFIPLKKLYSTRRLGKKGAEGFKIGQLLVIK
jgi:hypothetical protein